MSTKSQGKIRGKRIKKWVHLESDATRLINEFPFLEDALPSNLKTCSVFRNWVTVDNIMKLKLNTSEVILKISQSQPQWLCKIPTD
jgi:hypothetical protein